MTDKYTREEYEVILSFDYLAGEWTAWTNIPAYIKKFTKQGWTLQREEKYDDGTMCAARFTAPKAAISVGKAIRPKRNLSDKQRAALVKNLLKDTDGQILV